ncbi:surface carbohydrate biosynthesis protein [Sulfuritortus calidifontis]|uniref:Surface carbohydrate biosynthesis protein n=1 Tax=Sulfuritortus calidifontis TaxID=1914471 RepID=A0A4R3JW90_9PROT|nr:surface carbohydrate biosynthesis protein [Sulfuritortus calidifontis]TCS72486.1 surface carbohydrate biosynthesis protein [Sulfuritortus calidifontis]
MHNLVIREIKKSSHSDNEHAGRKVAVVIDNPLRDLRGLVLLAYQFAKRGATVFLVPMYQQGYDLPLLAPDLVVMNYARESNRSLLESYRTLGFRVAVLDTEGGVLSECGLDSPTNWANSFRNSGLAALVDDYCFWGEAVQSAFRLYSGINESGLAVTGCPRYDICNEPWARLLHYHRNGFVLVNTNFSAINPAFTRSAEDEQRLFRDQGWDAAYIQELFEELHEVFPRYLNTIETIARAMPNRVIQVRPHPFENGALYRKRFANISNVVIDGRGDIFDAIHGADCIVHLNCGSAIDAARMGKTPISMEFLNTEIMRRHAPLPSRISCHAANVDDLLDLINDPSLRAARYDLSKARHEIEPWYHLSDGKAAQRIAEFLLGRINKMPRRACRSLKAALRGGRSRPGIRQYLQGVLGLLIGSRTAAAVAVLLQRSRRGKVIDPVVVSELILRYRQLDGGPELQIRRLRSPIAGQPLSSFIITQA